MITTLLDDLSLTSRVEITDDNNDTFLKYIGKSSVSEIEQLVTYGFNNRGLDPMNIGNLLDSSSTEFLDNAGLISDFTDLFFPTFVAASGDSSYFFMLNADTSSIIVMDLQPDTKSLSLQTSTGRVLGLIYFEGDEVTENKYFVMLFEQSAGGSTISVQLHDKSKTPHKNIYSHILSELSAKEIVSRSLIPASTIGVDKRSNTILGTSASVDLTLSLTDGYVKSPVGALLINSIPRIYEELPPVPINSTIPILTE